MATSAAHAPQAVDNRVDGDAGGAREHDERESRQDAVLLLLLLLELPRAMERASDAHNEQAQQCESDIPTREKTARVREGERVSESE